MKTDSLTEPPSGGSFTVYWLTLLIISLTISSHALAETNDILQLSQQITLSEKPTKSNSNTLLVSGCDDYPYHDNRNQVHFGNQRLLKDLKSGLAQGLMCLSGNDPAVGKLHPYHHQQAFRLMDLLESDKTKSLQCVQDELFAYAIASSPQQIISSKKIQSVFKNSPELTILIDTFRVGGMLSKKLPESAYETFFKMDDEQIQQHLTGKPLRLNGVKRYENLPGLLFHEMVHWLGHLHTNTEPDITFLYDTCCFGGSDFVDDKNVNQNLQTRACNILKDDELWTANNYKKARLWKHKEYNELKREIIRHY
jgi:hypothetical protein